MESKVVDINEKRIVLTNAEIMALINPTQLKHAFDKMKALASIDGKKYYWVFKVMSKVFELAKKADEDRVGIAKELCDKKEDGSPIVSEGEFQFEENQQVLYNNEVVLNPNMTKEESDKLALLYCKKEANGKPIKVGTGNLTFSGDNRAQFNEAFTELMSAPVVLSINKITIPSELLEKMNNKITEDIIDYNDMIVLGLLFDFVE